MSHLTQNTRPFFILEGLNAVWLTTFSLTPMPGTVSFRSPEKEKRVWLWKRVRGCLQNINLQSGRIQGCFKVENIITWNPPITTLFGSVLWFNTLIMGASLVAQPANAGDLESIPGSGRSPGKGNNSPLQYSCLDNPMDRGAWQATVHEVAKELDMTWLSD